VAVIIVCGIRRREAHAVAGRRVGFDGHEFVHCFGQS